ncbi:hypothetical protein PENTCL1PPCAC_18482 [Pristionchus entomophagus]|uniref:G-patch domain-containing protein n=1 Tax=Pristionchus entomophagus TaxID=358040 RepID=A0AAV5TPY3_9BILA|nr:hypothetical protein PENTCL1PPCAC_18482 [Pristionchus entomophagus]
MTTEQEVPVESMEVAPSEPAKEPGKISFGVKKKLDTLVVKSESKSVAALDVAEQSDEDLEEEERAAKRRKLTHFENGSMPEDDHDKKKKAAVVIPMVMEVDWRVQKLLEQEKDGSITDVDRARLELLIGSNPELAEKRKLEQGENTDDAIVVDTSKTETEDADYNQVSIESFGLAILRGCGWKDGEGIGKNPQKVAMRLLERRPKGLGLGATPKTVDKKKEKNGDKKDEVSQHIKMGSLIKVTQGSHKGAYAKVDSRDDDNSSLVARLALGGRVVRVSLFACYAVSQKEFDKEGKVLNREEYDKEKRRIDKEKEKYEEKRRDRDDERKKEKRRDDRSEREYERRKEDDMEVWVRVDCRVRMISEDYKKGKHMDEKMRVVDVADRKNITLEDDSGRQHYNIRQSWLETVMPRNVGEKVVILRGRNRGAKGVMRAKDREDETLQVSLVPTHEIVKVSFDDACMWVPQVVDIDDDEC